MLENKTYWVQVTGSNFAASKIIGKLTLDEVHRFAPIIFLNSINQISLQRNKIIAQLKGNLNELKI